MIHAVKHYIRQELAKGYSLPIIKEELKNKGFSDEEIQRGLHETTASRVSLLHFIVLLLGLVMLNGLLGALFIALPMTMLPLAGRYLTIFLMPLLFGLLNYWIISQAMVDELEKNFAGILAPLPLIVLLNNFASFNHLLVPLGAGIASIWYAMAHLLPFAAENVQEKNHPVRWLIIAAAFVAVTILAAQLTNVFAHVTFTN